MTNSPVNRIQDDATTGRAPPKTQAERRIEEIQGPAAE